MAITRANIELGFQIVLGRSPESEAAYKAHEDHADLATFGRALLQSKEGRERFYRLSAAAALPIDLETQRAAYCFIHLEKTGGTSLYYALKDQFQIDRISPIHLPNLHSLTLAQLHQWDFIAGHFDFASTLCVPRINVKRLSVFRSPSARLISFYRFHRAHPQSAGKENPFVALAQSMSAPAFFAEPAIRQSPRLNNAYLHAFGSSLYRSALSSRAEIDSALVLAKRRINVLDAIGITEKLDESAAEFARRFGLRSTPQVVPMHQTDELADTVKNFARPPAVEMTQELEAALYPLICHDNAIYELAMRQFEQGRASSLPSST